MRRSHAIPLHIDIDENRSCVSAHGTYSHGQALKNMRRYNPNVLTLPCRVGTQSHALVRFKHSHGMELSDAAREWNHANNGRGWSRIRCAVITIARCGQALEIVISR